MGEKRTGVAIIGCGNIAGRYAKDLVSYPEVEIIGVSDIDAAKAEALAKEHGCKVYDNIDDMLADEKVKVVVNLTIHHAHYDVIKQCLEGGKHVFTEKPLALTAADAAELVELADSKKLRLGSAPFTWMGESQQTAWKMMRDGKLGDVRLVYAEVNHGRIESWHPNPGPFYQVGPWFDVGVYPLTMLTTFFGPAKKVTAVGKVLFPDRTTNEGKVFHIDTPDCVIAIIELAGGQLVRLTANFYVKDTKQAGIEFHGDKGSLHIGSWQVFHTPLSFAEFGKGLKEQPLLREPYEGCEWGRGIREMVDAIREKRPHRATGAQASHVVEILEAAMVSLKEERPVEIKSEFPQPKPMDWAE